jgi:hypothetical protein
MPYHQDTKDTKLHQGNQIQMPFLANLGALGALVVKDFYAAD